MKTRLRSWGEGIFICLFMWAIVANALYGMFGNGAILASAVIVLIVILCIHYYREEQER